MNFLPLGLTDLTDYVNNTSDYNFEDFEAPIRELAVHDGKIYSIPYLNYAVGLIVRQDLFDDPALQEKFQTEFGKPLAIPTTLDEYVRSGQILQGEWGCRRSHAASVRLQNF